MVNVTDENLYSQMLASPEKAFRAIYDRHSGPLLRYVYRFTSNQELAEEILHDIFIQLLAGKFNPTETGSLKAWLYTLAKNKSLNHLKKSSLKKKVDSSHSSEDQHHFEESQNLNLNLFKLSCAEQNLPEDLCQTWALRKKGLDYQQIATQLSIPVGTVKSRFHRLIEHLKKEFDYES